jgi:hypothetical protein
MHFLILLRSGLIILFAIFVLYFLCMTAFVIPIWSFKDVITSEEWSTGQKLAWVVGIAFFWTLGGLVYGAFRSHSQALRKQAKFVAILILMILAGYPWIAKFLTQRLTIMMASTLEHISQARLGDVSEAQRAEMKQDLQTLGEEASGSGYMHRQELDRLNQSIKFADALVADGILDRSEWDDWHHYFMDRKSEDIAHLKLHVMQLELNNLKLKKK